MRSTAMFALLFLLFAASAQAASAPWAWNSYSGTSYWQVEVSEDDSGCEGEGFNTQFDISIEHNLNSAVMGDVGHGPVSGTFISPNILHIPARTVPDPPGSSDLSAYDIFFTTDCSTFTGRYTWDYSGPEGGCSGSTTLSGSNSEGCPLMPGTCRSGLDCNTTSTCVEGVCVSTQIQGVCVSDSDCNSGKICVDGACVAGPPSAPPPAPLNVQLTTARQDLNNDLLTRQYKDQLMEELERSYGWFPPGSAEEGYAKMIRETNPRQMKNVQDDIDKAEAGIEAKYQAILSVDPNNVQANWDMAELRKSQGNYDDYKTYMDRSLGKMSDGQAQEVKADVQSSIGLQTTPTPDTSKVLQQVGNEAKEIKSVAGVDFSQLTEKQRSNVVKNLLIMTLFDKNGDVLSAMNIQFK